MNKIDKTIGYLFLVGLAFVVGAIVCMIHYLVTDSTRSRTIGEVFLALCFVMAAATYWYITAKERRKRP
jgi:fucose permease